jgi:hypothetical protein
MADREKSQSVNCIQLSAQGNEYPAFIKAAKILTVSVTIQEDPLLWLYSFS